MRPSEVLIKPILTEKANSQQESLRRYAFRVSRKANKLEIKQAVEQLFGKTVIAVRTANYDGKLRRQRRADAGRTNHWKKAIVRLKEGESLDLV